MGTELLCKVKLILSPWCRRDEPLTHRHGENPVVLNIEPLTAGPHLFVILLDNPHPQSGQSLPHIVAYLLVQAMIEQHHLALQVVRGRSDQDVAWVGVGVDEAGVEELVSEDVQDVPVDPSKVESSHGQGILVTDLDTVYELRC